MSANFYELLKYAATGLASPDMTAYDKMRALATFGDGTVQTLTGQPPLTFKADGSPLISWSMKGNGSQTGTPTPDNPVMPEFVGVRTENLASPLKEWVDGYVNRAGSIIPPSTVYMEKSSDFLDIPNNTVSVTFSGEDGIFERGSSDGWRAIAFYNSNKEFVSREGSPGTNAISASIPGSARFMRISCRTYGSDKEYTLNLGRTALPYEPYGYKIPITCAGQTTPVYLGEVQTTRQIKKVVFDGTEPWALSGTTVYINNTDAKKLSPLICTHFPNVENTGMWNGNNWAFQVNISRLGMSGREAWITWLAEQYVNGTPVCVWYILSEPTTGIINEPLCKIGDYADELHSEDAGVTIPTVKGSNTLTVDTELQPSEMAIAYRN